MDWWISEAGFSSHLSLGEEDRPSYRTALVKQCQHSPCGMDTHLSEDLNDSDPLLCLLCARPWMFWGFLILFFLFTGPLVFLF